MGGNGKFKRMAKWVKYDLGVLLHLCIHDIIALRASLCF